MTTARGYAVTFVAQEQAELVPVALPDTPLAPSEVAGRTLVSLISAGTELASYRGEAAYMHPGYASVFEVDAVGSDVTDLQAGDVAFCMGPHQSVQRAQRGEVLPLPEGLAPETAVFARLMCVTMSTLVTTTARPPDLVVVSGLGLVGHLAARIFHHCGYEVIACDPVEARRTLISAAGIRRVEARVPLEDPDVAGRVGLVVECSGHEQAVLDGCMVVRRRGEVVLVGVPWARMTDLSARDLLHAVFHRYVVLRSGWEWELALHATDFRTGSIYGNLATALRWLAQGRITVDGLHSIMPASQVQDAYQALLHRTSPRLAIILDWRAEGSPMG